MISKFNPCHNVVYLKVEKESVLKHVTDRGEKRR